MNAMSPKVVNFCPSFPRTREPMLNMLLTLSMGSRLRGNDVVNLRGEPI